MPRHSLPALFRLNAAFSAVTGVSALVARGVVADALAVPAPAVTIVGIGLITFAAGLTVLSSRPVERLSGWGKAVSTADAGWVVASIAFLAAHTPEASGTALVLTTSMVVGALAAAQWASRDEGDNRRGPRVIEVASDVDATADDLWEVMTDSDLYGRLAPNLSKVGEFSTGSDGTPTQRRCWDRLGKHWDETCTAWSPGQTYSVRVHTDAPDYPYPLRALRGMWSVAPLDPDRSRVTIRFEFDPRPGVAGSAFAASLFASGPAISKRIISGWAKEAAARTTRSGAEEARPALPVSRRQDVPTKSEPR